MNFARPLEPISFPRRAVMGKGNNSQKNDKKNKKPKKDKKLESKSASKK
jgi:hypothetical protein